jgi:16S rRNA (cytosine967-C5)-methyltransferase
VERSGAFASILLQKIGGDVPEREVRLATEIVYGCLRFKLRDEHVLVCLAGRPLDAIDPDIALLFRIAAHQVLRLDRIPERAAVAEAVAAARALPGRGAEAARRREGGSRLLNAVLRRLCREKGSLPLPALPAWIAEEEAAAGGAGASGGPPSFDAEALAAALAVHHSHPEWIVRRWIDRFGPRGAAALLAADNAPAPLSVRVDTARAGVAEAASGLAAEGVRTRPSEVLDDFLRVVAGAPQRTGAFRRGIIYIQDEASGIVPRLLGLRPGARVLDACAAPGGKALQMARIAGEEGIVVAGDRRPSRLALVRANARRMRVPRVLLVAGDFGRPPLRGEFDAALVDAPCSGSGVFRRDVESRYRLAPEDLAALARAQRALLDGVAPLVRRGGRIVYAVCSVEPEEGPDLIAGFLADHAGFAAADLRPALPARPDLFAPDGSLRTLPHLHDLDGFYAAGLVRA